MKCNHQISVAEEAGEVGDESDEEINHLKQRIRMRRRQRQEEKQRHLMPVSLLSDGKTDSKYVGGSTLWIGENELINYIWETLGRYIFMPVVLSVSLRCSKYFVHVICINYFLLLATTTDQSVSPLSSSSGTPSESVSTDDVDDLEVDEVKNLAQLKNTGKLLYAS